ncbi:MAG: glycosyltransferase family 2 protein [bacterium]|nr:glycosyltransferase family 2 protein [bacterium]
MKDLTVVVLSYETRDLLLECLASVEQALHRPAARLDCEVIVVDNGSSDGSAAAVRDQYPWIVVVELTENRGFAAGNNVALARAKGRYVALLNSDVVLAPGALERTLDVLEVRKDAGAAGIQLLHPDGRLQNSIHGYPSLPRELVPNWLLELLFPTRLPSKRRPAREPIEVESVLGAVLVVRREVIDQVGPLPEAYFFFLEETDWCWRMRRAGWKVLHIPDARAIHRLGASSKCKDPSATRIEYHRSLYHFLRENRGAASATGVMIVRIAKSLLVLLPLSLLAPFSTRHRSRLHSALRPLCWHAAGRPAEWGLVR